MATLARFQAFALDDAGNVLASPTVDVRDETTAALATLFSDRAGSSGMSNPFTGNSDGSFGFHVQGGAYKITATKGAVTRTFRYVAIGTAGERDTAFDASNNFVPPTNNNNALGTTSLQWADLFLGSGAVINFNAGNVTLTHSLLASSPADPGLLTLTGNLTITGGLLQGRHQPRLSTAASGDVSPDLTSADLYVRTALSAAIAINAPIGNPQVGERLIFRFKDNGTARALTWNGIFRAIGTAIPATTTINKTLWVCAFFNATDTKWDVLGVNLEA